MVNKDQYIEDLEKYLDESYWENERIIEEVNSIENTNEIRDCEMYLLCFAIDKSGSMYNYGLEKAVINELKDVKRVVNNSQESKYIQTAMTFFDSNLEIRPFKYGVHIDTSYEAKGYKSRLYDAIVESCNIMIDEYDKYYSQGFSVRGTMFLLTDGEECGSEKYELQDVRQAIEEFKVRNLRFIVPAFDGVDSTKLAKELEIEPIQIKDDHQLRKLMKFVTPRTMA